jgi:signal transduction histidine kinase
LKSVVFYRKMIKRIISFLFTNPDELGFDAFLVLLLSLLATITGIVSTFVNIILGLGFWITILTFLLALLFGINYYLGRFYYRHIYSKHATIILMLISINVEWTLNFGSYGPILYLFVVIQSCIIILFQKKERFFFTLFILLNVSVLFYLEYTQPGVFKNYSDNSSRLLDLYTSTLIYLMLSILLLSVALNFYVKQKERAEKADYLKSAFLANITHEIRTPMNAILGFSQILEKEISLEKRKKYTKIIIENGQYLMHLIDDILDISKIEANQLEIHFTEFDVNTLIDDVKQIISQFLVRIEKTHLKLINQVVPNNIIINSDKDRIKQVLTNLLSNAAKFTDEGKIIFGYKILPASIEFFVEDTGSGIPKEKIDDIFKRFNKVESQENGMFNKGTGIGLSISKQIVELLGGNISVTSEVGKGSRFSFVLPINNSEN